ncbi:aspartate aminotransferase family protein [Verrucomicrobia bacterium]|nr:aspartate aminotransferase family protein [Verrucomicrobiota bacterium]
MHANIVRDQCIPTSEEGIKALFDDFVLSTYGRFPLTLQRGKGSHVWDVNGRRYLDMGGGIAVNVLGHAHPELVETLSEQASTLMHCSNLYYQRWQGELARELVHRIGNGKCFFANSGAEANEGMFKLARKFGSEEGRFEILSCQNSFHGRTMAGIAATGQPKVKEGFAPMVPGFRHVPFNDLEAVEKAISPATVAILLEGVQGEGGILPASPEYLKGLRALCDQHDLLMLWDGIQCGHYRTGYLHSYASILSDDPQCADFVPDAISMAKSLGGGFPLGAFWVRERYQDILGAGTHGSTFGGNPLACSVALKILEIIKRDSLDKNAVQMGGMLMHGLRILAAKFPDYIQDVRGLGLMIGLVFHPRASVGDHVARPVSLQIVECLHAHGMLTIPSGTQVVRFLPGLNILPSEVEEALSLLNTTLESIEI